MKWYTVDEKFLDYLRGHEPRIPYINYGKDKLKPFFGVLFEIGDLVYITQVSHPQSRHYSMKENIDFYKLYKDLQMIGVVNLNYMFPVFKDRLQDIDYKNISNFRTFESEKQKNDYITLLKREMREIRNKRLDEKASELYKYKYEFPDDAVSKRCFDFKFLEQKCIEYNK